MKKKLFTIMAVITVIALISGATLLAAASPGTDADPLITLSYLNGPFRKLIESDIADALSKVTARINTVEQKIENELSDARESTANTFKFAEIDANSSLTLPDGSEIMLREGSITLSAGSLIRYTGDGGVLTSGNLETNNMYIARQDVKLTAGNAAAKLWIRGDAVIDSTEADETKAAENILPAEELQELPDDDD